jgi:hypothetical protein
MPGQCRWPCVRATEKPSHMLVPERSLSREGGHYVTFRRDHCPTSHRGPMSGWLGFGWLGFGWFRFGWFRFGWFRFASRLFGWGPGVGSWLCTASPRYPQGCTHLIGTAGRWKCGIRHAHRTIPPAGRRNVAVKRNQPRSVPAGLQFLAFQLLLVLRRLLAVLFLLVVLLLLVGKKGVEPSRPFGHTDLNRARLPFRHFPGRNLKHCSLGPSSTHLSSKVPPRRALPDPVAWTRIDRDPAGGRVGYHKARSTT